MAKYIDADAALDTIDRIIELYPSELGKIKQAFLEMPAADVEPVRKWIPCSEKLPEHLQTVLCLCNNGGITVSCITYKRTKLGDVVRFGQHYVKAWMPLLILPKIDGGNADETD